jgi:hypothetical protein
MVKHLAFKQRQHILNFLRNVKVVLARVLIPTRMVMAQYHRRSKSINAILRNDPAINHRPGDSTL